MKLIFVTGGLISGGAERVMSIIANGLSERGFNVSIISKQHVKPFYKLNEQVKILYPKNKISYNKGFKRFFSILIVLIDIFKILKLEKPDVVIPFSTTTNGSIIIVSKLLKIKVIASEHSNYKFGLKNPSNWFIKRLVYKMSDYLMLLTQRDADEYYSSFIKNIVVMPNPLPLSPINYNTEFQKAKIILAIGNVSRWKTKGFDNLLTIFANIQNKIPKYKLVIIGGGDKTFLKNICKTLNIIDRVEFVGEVTDVKNYMQKASVFVLTSRIEGLPMVLIEAMSQGLPCVAYDCFTGPAEIITNGKDGVLINDQNKEDFGQQLIKLLENKNKLSLFSKQAILKSKKYDANAILDKWEDLINKI